jgi:hypothetical protein
MFTGLETDPSEALCIISEHGMRAKITGGGMPEHNNIGVKRSNNFGFLLEKRVEQIKEFSGMGQDFNDIRQSEEIEGQSLCIVIRNRAHLGLRACLIQVYYIYRWGAIPVITG